MHLFRNFICLLPKSTSLGQKEGKKKKEEKCFLICSFKENVSCKHHSIFAKCSDDAFLTFLDLDVLSALSGRHCNQKPASPAFLMVFMCRYAAYLFVLKNQNEMHFPEYVMHIGTKAAILFHLNYHFRHQANTAPQFLKLTFLYLIKHHYIVVSSQ